MKHSFLLLFAVISTCKCKECDLEIFPNFYVHNKKKYFTRESIQNDEHIYFDGNQIFEQRLLIDFDCHLIHNTVAFEGYTNAYNLKIKTIKDRKLQRTSSSSEDRDST